MVQDRLGEFLWSRQREIAEAVVRHRYVAVKSAHDTGKSHEASRIVAWWLDEHEDPFATTTAPTTKQVHAILWRYIGQAHRKGKLKGRITLDDEWYMGPGGKELVAFGREPADTIVSCRGAPPCRGRGGRSHAGAMARRSRARIAPRGSAWPLVV